MKKSFLISGKILSVFLILNSCSTTFPAYAEEINCQQKNETKKKKVEKPLTLIMPSANYNERPAGTKIDAVIIHHTAPFPSLTRVGYFFQNVDSRVSAHYTIGKEGLIIESVPDNLRAWHGGPSSWLGKYNLNDYSIGIEILNDGDSKDPFTEPQYNALAKLTAFLLDYYQLPIERVIGHRDIAIPLGRKIDPADNFDWDLFKAKIRKELKKSNRLFGQSNLPSANLPYETEIRKMLKSTNETERKNALENLLTYPQENFAEDLEEAWSRETNPEVKARFLNLFSSYQKKQFINQARNILLQNETPVELKVMAIKYLTIVDPDFASTFFREMLVKNFQEEKVMIALINSLGVSKDEINKKVLTDLLARTENKEIKKAIITALAGFAEQKLNPLLFKYLEEEQELCLAAIETLRITYDPETEKRFLQLIGKEKKEVVEALTWVFLRNKSVEGLKALMPDRIYENLDLKLKIALFNTIAQLKMTDAEDWLLEKTKNTEDFRLQQAGFLNLSRLGGEKSFNFLLNSYQKNPNPKKNYTLLKALTDYNRPEILPILKNILENDSSPSEAKILAVAAIKQNKIVEIIPFLEKIAENKVENDLKIVIRETNEFLRKSK